MFTSSTAGPGFAIWEVRGHPSSPPLKGEGVRFVAVSRPIRQKSSMKFDSLWNVSLQNNAS
jgi:hypothetical protein